MSVSKTLTVASLIITAALLCQYIIAAGLMTVFSLGFVTAWWMAILPAMLLLLSTIGFAQEVVAASQMKKMLETMPIFNS
jgi:amino acid transporter